MKFCTYEVYFKFEKAVAKQTQRPNEVVRNYVTVI